MRNFAISALVAVAVDATYQTLKITKDGNSDDKYFRSQDWTDAPLDLGGTRVAVKTNNSLLIKNQAYDGYEYAYKPYIRGGAIEYTVDLSNHGCGCVAGVYAVAIRAGCNGEEEQQNMSTGSVA